MASGMYFWTTILLLCNFIEAKPICSNSGSGQIACIPGNYSNIVLKRGIVSDNNTTKSIILSNCRISDVDYESFNRLPALTHLDLSKNIITRLKLGVLDGFRNLLHLDLSYNYLTTFPLGVFDQKTNLIHLDLGSNKINTLELGIFDPLTKLEYLDISSNLLIGADIDPYIFDQSRQIKSLKFSRNDMRHSNDNLLHALIKLQRLGLEECQLEEIPAFVLKSSMKSLQELNLSTNRIREIANELAFANLVSLKWLNLTSNIIEDIGENVFKPLKKLTYISLRDNRLKKLPDTLFQNIPLTTIDVSRNLIEYVPVNAFRGTKTKYLNLSHNRLTFLQDNFCLELRNSGPLVTKFYFNDNPWQCSCLRDVLNEVRRFKISYNAFKYDGKHPVCVVGNDSVCHRHVQYNDNVYELYFNT